LSFGKCRKRKLLGVISRSIWVMTMMFDFQSEGDFENMETLADLLGQAK